MICLRVDIVGFVDESFPGLVRCAFVDANGNRHTFIEKIPVVTFEDLWSDSVYPQNGTVPCLKVESLKSDTARRLARVTIDPLDSPADSDYSEFIVCESQLVNQ
jgi:hypothetical protein